MARGNPTITVRLSLVEIRQLHVAAELDDSNVSTIVREALRDYMKEMDIPSDAKPKHWEWDEAEHRPKPKERRLFTQRRKESMRDAHPTAPDPEA